jgi:hypothetical protein
VQGRRVVHEQRLSTLQSFPGLRPFSTEEKYLFFGRRSRARNSWSGCGARDFGRHRPFRKRQIFSGEPGFSLN